MKREGSQSGTERIKIYITIKDLYFRFRKGSFFFFFEVSFSWCCVWREKETTCTESARCCFLITGFFPKRLLSSPDKAVSPLDPRIGMSLILLLLGISKSFHTSKLAPEKLYETFSPAVVQSTGMRRAPSCPGLRVSSTWFTRWGCTRRVLQLS